jgi:phosphoribosylformylglycinamidine synthase
MKANVFVTLKQDVLDPEGLTIKNALNTLNYKNIKNVRMGKFIVIEFTDSKKNKVEEDLKKICHDILSNPIIEDYTYKIED